MPLNSNKSLFLLAAIGFSIACTPANARDQPSDAPSRGSGCTASAKVSLADLSLAPGQADTVLRTVRWQNVAQGSWRLLESHELRGVCTDEITYFEMNRVGLGATRVLVIDNGALSLADLPAASVTGSVDEPRPALPDAGEFVSATEVGARRIGDDLQRQYLGLWREGSTSTVASFILIDDQVVSIRRLFSSDVPLTTLGYFPMPDANAGMIGLTQKIDENAAHLIVFYWDHNNWFK